METGGWKGWVEPDEEGNDGQMESSGAGERSGDSGWWVIGGDR